LPSGGGGNFPAGGGGDLPAGGGGDLPSGGGGDLPAGGGGDLPAGGGGDLPAGGGATSLFWERDTSVNFHTHRFGIPSETPDFMCYTSNKTLSNLTKMGSNLGPAGSFPHKGLNVMFTSRMSTATIGQIATTVKHVSNTTGQAEHDRVFTWSTSPQRCLLYSSGFLFLMPQPENEPHNCTNHL
jgi:hypothetical protein